MTEEIIIDGVNVAGCKYYDDETCCNNDVFTLSCEKTNCMYKQLKRLEQENKKLKKDVQLFKCLDTFGESECHCACRCLGNEFCEDAEIKINKYKTALEEIRDYCKFNFVSANPILNKINEVLND